MNYIITYRSGIDCYPISIFIQEEHAADYNITCEEDAVNMVLKYGNPAFHEVACKKTLLDYDSYVDDRDNIIIGMLNILDE